MVLLLALISSQAWGAPHPAKALKCQPLLADRAPQIRIYDPEAALSRNEIGDLSLRMKASTPDGKQAGDRLVRALQPLIHRTADAVSWKMANAHSPVNFEDPNIREELESAVLLKLISVPPFNPERSTVEGWVTMLTKTAAIDMQRRASRHMNLSLDREIPGLDSITLKDSLAGKEADPSDAAATADSRARVRKALGMLPASKRQLMEMVYVDHLTYREISERLDIPLGSVKSHIHHTKSELKSILTTLPE